MLLNLRSFFHIGNQRTTFDQCHFASVKLQDKTLSWKAIGILCFVLGNKHLPLLCPFNNFCTHKYILSNLMYINEVFMSCDRLLLMAGIYLLHQTFFDRLLLWGRWSWTLWALWKAQRLRSLRPLTLCPWCFPSLSGWSVAIFMPVSMVTSFRIT